MSHAKYENVNRMCYPIEAYSGNGLVTTSYADDAVVRGSAYSIRQTFTIPVDGLKGIVFDPSLLEHDAFLEPFRVSVTIGPLRLKLYTDISITEGLTELPAVNRSGLIDEPHHKMKVYDTFTGLDLGTNQPLEYVIGSKSTNQTSGGAVAAGERIFPFLRDKKYYLEFDNNEGSGEINTASLQFDWVEV